MTTYSSLLPALALTAAAVMVPATVDAQPSRTPLTPGVTYFWRVRPRSGDNPASVGWSRTWSFVTPGSTGAGSTIASLPATEARIITTQQAGVP